MLPAGALLLVFLTYPLGPGHLARLHRRQDRPRRASGSAAENFVYLFGDSVARLSLFNTLFYTVVASILKFVLGLWLALLLNQHLPFKSFMRAIVLLPFIVPTALSAIAFWWLYDSQFSVISWTLTQDGPDRPLHRFPRRAVARAPLDHRRERLARRAFRRDLPAGGPADRPALAVRSGLDRRRDAAGSSSGMSRCRC